MNTTLEKAKKVIYEAVTPHGILASSHHIDNYARIWSRDSMMTGLAGMLLHDEVIITAFKNSVLTLATHQHEYGMIPSNVAVPEMSEKSVSFGSLAGRTDATLWWLIGALTLLEQDKEFYEEKGAFLLPKIEKAVRVLHAWEFNGRGLLYSPLGGNWADEYVTSGYTLYDNVLYYKALALAGTFLKSDKLYQKALFTKSLIMENYDNAAFSSASYYHAGAIEKRKHHLKPYFSASLAPNGFDQRWDMAGNALALYFGLYRDTAPLTDFLEERISAFGSGLIPVFYPVIDRNDPDWHLLEQNFAYSFKNEPYQFHNGGFWPVFAGWLVLGLKKYNQNDLANNIMHNYVQVLKQSENLFYEYHDIRTGFGKGVEKLCFSAAGYIFMTARE